MTYLNGIKVNHDHHLQWIELTHVSSIHFDTMKPIQGFKLNRPKLEGTASTSYIAGKFGRGKVW